MTDIIKRTSFADCNNHEIEYLILNSAVMTRYKSLTDVVYAYCLDPQKVAKSFFDLLEEGSIVVNIFSNESNIAFEEEDIARNVIFTTEGVQDCLNERFKACYCLTLEGGEKWEKNTKPEWNNFTVFNWGGIFGLDYPDGITGANLENVKRMLDMDYLIKPEKHILGTERWTEYHPFWATYWKQLEKGYNVSYDTHDILTWAKKYLYDEFELSENQELDPEEKEFIRRQRRWYDKIKNWYTPPQWYQDIIIYQESK
jgi:hypothetical protein